MDEYLEDMLDVTSQKIVKIEKDLSILHDGMIVLAEQIKETQRYLIKMAQNQAEVTKRVAQWPYIAVQQSKGDNNA